MSKQVPRRVAMAWALALLAPGLGNACSYPQPPSLDQLLKDANSVAVVFVEATQVRERGPRSVVFFDDFLADIRVVENLLGDPMHARNIAYSAGWCGGFEIVSGEYYVLVAPPDATEVRLAPGHPRLLRLFDEYNEGDGSRASRSELLMEFRNFARTGKFLETFPTHDYAAFTRREFPPNK